MLKTSDSHVLMRLGFYGLIVVVVLGVLASIRLLFEPLLAAILLSFAFRPVVNYFEIKGLPRLVVIVLLCSIILGILLTVVMVLTPMVLEQIGNVKNRIPQYEGMLRDVLSNVQGMIGQRFPGIQLPDLYQLVYDKLSGYIHFDYHAVFSYASNVFSVLATAVAVPIITFFLLLEGHLVQKTLLRMVPNRYFEMFVLLFHNVAKSIQAYIRGQLIDSSALGLIIALGLTVIGFPNAALIGVVAAVGSVIPYLGTIIGILPALFVVLTTPEWLGALPIVKVAAVFALAQFIEGNFIYPLAVGGSVNLHPVVILLGLMVGGQVGGILGMVVAVPFMCIVKVTIEVLYSHLKSYSII